MSPRRYVYLHGFASGPGSKKAQFFREQLAKSGIDLTIPDLAQGDFEHLTITGQLDVIREAVDGGPAVLIGSSMGGYLAALYAAGNAEIARLVLMAPAFAFPARWPQIVGEAEARQWRQNGFLPFYHYGEQRERLLSYRIIEDGMRYPGYPDFRQPALIFHGRNDSTVPPHLSEHFACEHHHAKLTLLDSDHELIDALPAIWEQSVEFLTA
jgi:pimeloyl-ACP methyl ester carboxylesterase